jgi:hypothetical protein
MKPIGWIFVLTLAVTALTYTEGLNGPFLFDDHVHITQNQWVQIKSLDWDSLAQAWNSSFSAFPANRPLAQLTFGVNHAFSGLNPWAFKVTNLIIHLVNGGLVFAFVRLAYRASAGTAADSEKELQLALATAALWLLHPMHVSTVLYPVQRMALLSTCSLLLSLTSYFWGRLRIAQGRQGSGWIIASAPIAALGFLAKENTVLLPLLLLASEMTLLRTVATGQRKVFLRTIWGLFIVLPLLAGLLYLLTHHTALLVYEGRPFSLEERLLTQPRVLWIYLKWLFVPDISAFGLFHDDVAISTGLLSPPSTLVAIIGLGTLTVAAVLTCRKNPIAAFAVLFFLANHALESTILPLEMIFEHRNYLASLGPLFFLAYLIIIASPHFNVRSLAVSLGVLLLLSYTFVTYTRVSNWSSYKSFIFSAAKNHPNSARSNFMAGQMLISAVAKSDVDAPELADAARSFLQNGLSADPRCINCMFGLIVLDLHLDAQPDTAAVARLADSLRSGDVGPTKVSIGQFSYLVKWQRSDGAKLPTKAMEAIFEAALANPAWSHTGRAGIETAYREYWEYVAQDLSRALHYAQAAVRSWPEQWSYHMNLVRLLVKSGLFSEALTAIDEAARVADNQTKQRETAEVRASIERDLEK